MKNLFRNISLFLIFTLSFGGVLGAKDIALIVKQDGAKVYLDTSSFKVKPQKGDAFRVAEWGEELINPKTGKNLGKILKRQLDGKIIQTEELYAIGQLDSEQNVFSYEAEIFVTAPAPVAPATVQPQAMQGGLAVIQPVMQTKNIDGKIKAAAFGDVDGDGSNDAVFAFAEDNSVKVFALQGQELKEVSSFALSPLRKIIALDAADLKQAGRAQIFASVYDSSSEKFYTLVLEAKGQTLEQTDTVRGIVKGISVQGGPRDLYVQDFSPATGFSSAAQLVYQGGAFERGATLSAYSFESIFGFNLFDFKEAGRKNIIYTTPAQKLRIQFEKRGSYTESPSGFDFATTPTRLKINGKPQRLYTPVLAFKNAAGQTVVGALEHQTKLGLLSDVFGSYSSAKLYFLNWTGNGLTPKAVAEIPGVACDMAQTSFGPYKDAVIVPFASTAGQSAVLVFDASAA